MRIAKIAFAFLLCILGFSLHSQAATAPAAVDIPYDRFVLANGLRVIVHTDRKVPIVAVSVWYHVGSKDEPKGKSGFAHLFEHLMFSGSEHNDRSYINTMEEVGASDLNGTTAFDRTNYFETVPTAALNRTLWLESDRMGHLVGSISKVKLDNQRDVVKNEKRQGDNQPYGLTEYRILEGLFPEGHPYRVPTIGSEKDLDAASLDDVKTWFKTYYGPDNAVLVLAGDIDLKSAKPLVEKYFAAIPAGPPIKHLKAWVPERRENVHEVMQDHVSTVRINRVWAAPGSPEDVTERLSLSTTILGGTSTSRLYRDLVLEKQLAIGVSCSIDPSEVASQLHITADVKPGVDPARVEARIDAVLAEYLKNGPTKDELARAVVGEDSGAVRALEKIGGFGGKAVTLAEGELYDGDPASYKRDYIVRHAATQADIQRDSQRWFGNGYYQLNVVPTNKVIVAQVDADRSKLPALGTAEDLKFPTVARAKLSNGISVVLAERHAVPKVSISVVFDAGSAADRKDKLGAASFVTALLDQGTIKRSGIQISETLERLGADIGASAGADTVRVGLSTLVGTLPETLDVYADIIRNPSFTPEQMERVRQIKLAGIAQEQDDPLSVALRELPPLIYGPDHPYGVPLTGSGTVASVKALTRNDLVDYQKAWLRPDTATLFVVGDTTLATIMPMLEKAFGNWQNPNTPHGTKTLSPVALPEHSRIVIIDRPGAPQSYILGGYVLPQKGTDGRIDFNMLNDILGGQFSSRINQNLREVKGWSYGASSFAMPLKGQMPWIVYAPVQTDKTADSLREALAEVRAIMTTKPATLAELGRTVTNTVSALPGDYETGSAVLGGLINNAVYNRADNYHNTLSARYRALTVNDLANAAKNSLFPDHMIWLVAGDRNKIEAGLRALNVGPVEVRESKP